MTPRRGSGHESFVMFLSEKTAAASGRRASPSAIIPVRPAHRFLSRLTKHGMRMATCSPPSRARAYPQANDCGLNGRLGLPTLMICGHTDAGTADMRDCHVDQKSNVDLGF